MAGGDGYPGAAGVADPGRGPGVIGHAPGDTVNIYVRLPVELDWVIRSYQLASRLPSLGYTFQALLQTHPAIVAFAERLYNNSQASPGGTRESS